MKAFDCADPAPPTKNSGKDNSKAQTQTQTQTYSNDREMCDWKIEISVDIGRILTGTTNAN